MRSKMVLLVVLSGLVSVATADQIVFDYSESNLLIKLPDGTGDPVVQSFDSGNPGSPWYSCYHNIGVIMPDRYQAERMATKFDLSGLVLGAGQEVVVNEARLRLAVKTSPAWYAPAEEGFGQA